MSSFRLRIKLEEGETWQEIPITNSLTIGRSDECDFILPDRLASRKHAQLSIQSDSVYLLDLNSSNGTKILGQRILPNVPRKLSESDFFTIGHTLFQVVSTQERSPFLLWYRIEGQPWQQVPFRSDFVIGRGEDAGLQLKEGNISRQHAILRVSGGNFYLEDLGSQNGTFLEGKQLAANQPVSIFPGQYFRIGRVTFAIAEAEKQAVFHQTLAEVSSQPAIPAVQQYRPTPAARVSPPKKKSALPWLLGIGGLLMVCVCVVVVGGLYLLDRAAGEALAELEQASDFVTENQDEIIDFIGENQEQLGNVVEEGLEVIENSEQLIPGGDEGILTEAGDLVEGITDLVEDTPITQEQDQTTQGQTASREWLVMLYQDGDDETLEYDIFFDVNTAETVGSTDDVAIVAQLDRYRGSYSGDGDWSGARRYYLSPDGELEKIASPVLADLGEVDSGDVNTLVDFAIWAMETYPAEHYLLVLSDHGGGWFGGYTDGDNENIDGIYLPALESALQYITQQTGVNQIDILGFDACLMAELEVWAAVAPYASIGVASEETESATGWAYGAFLGRLVDNPAMTPEDLSRAIVETFVVEDLAYPFWGEDPSYVMRDSTLSAIRLSGLSAIKTALDGLVLSIQNIDQSLVAEARTYTRSYIVYSDYQPFLLDLVHFGQMVCSITEDTSVCGASAGVEQAVKNAIIIEKHGSGMDGSNGVTFYFPDSEFFDITKDNYYGFAYRAHAVRFTETSTWDEFLDLHYQIVERMP